jgi:MSHA biogenesis protein MshQ
VSAVISQSSLGTDTGISSIGGETNAAAGGENTASYGFGGNIDEVLVYQGALTTAQMDAVRTTTHACAVAGPNHLELRHGSGTGLTCTPSTLTVVACSDAACATPYTGGVTGTLTATGAGMTVNWPSGAPFAIASGSSSTTESMQVTTAGSVVLGASGISPAPAAATLCNFGSPSCTFTAADSGFVFNVANHVADVLQTPVSVSAVRKSDNSALCVPAFASVGKSVTFTCAYQNPASGSLPIRVGGSALNAGNSAAAACDATGRAVSLAFDATGLANTTVQYADVGQVQLNARYAGSGSSETGLVMTGADSFTTAPATFAFSAITAAPIKAGIAFAATATAVNNSGIATPNFGRESTPSTATLAFTRASPTGTGASNGAFSGSLGAFSAGVASASNLVWSEVGLGDLRATLTGGNYLASGLTVTGTTGTGGAVGRFIPHHFDVVVTPACSSFSYAAQPFTATVSAKNGLATPGITVNYDGSSNTTPSFAKAVILIDAPSLGVGSFGSTGTLAASAFSAGVATAAPAYSFTNKLTAAQTLVVRASDTDAVNSLGYAEGSTALRSGRLRLSNAFGSEKSALPMALQAEYWSGNDWVPNGADNCTSVPAAAVARSGYLDNKGAASAAWTTTASAIAVLAGSGTLTLSAPSPTLTGSVDLALNLGATTSDQSCLATHPASTGAALPWLRTQQGNCAATWDRDPAARASFGIYAPETRKTLYVRELY